MNPNSALNWLPKIEKAGLPTPRTLIEPYSHHGIAPIFDGESSEEFGRIVSATHGAADKIGLPVFIRTDLGSAKHDGPRAYRLSETGSAAPLLCRLFEDQEMKFWTEREGPTAIMIREWIPMLSHFEAFGGLPVNREFRFFSDGLNILCAHPYWPSEAIEKHVDEVQYPNWRKDLESLHAQPSLKEMDLLIGMTITAARAQDSGQWSVDFAQDTAGKWWLIDMARMEDSFHWPACDNS